MQLLLLLAVFVIATCGLIYELVAGSFGNYRFGFVTPFFTVAEVNRFPWMLAIAIIIASAIH